mgnify:FL=1|tara:strand:+ start:187 stop:465 length:279 start_codon:yes stop_codon:yes gene_type:complete
MAKENVYDASLGKFVEIEVDNREDPNAEENLLQSKKQERTAFLKESDWTTSTDSPLTDEQKSEAITYRQALRDLPAQNGFPNIAFPTKPNFI